MNKKSKPRLDVRIFLIEFDVWIEWVWTFLIDYKKDDFKKNPLIQSNCFRMNDRL